MYNRTQAARPELAYKCDNVPRERLDATECSSTDSSSSSSSSDTEDDKQRAAVATTTAQVNDQHGRLAVGGGERKRSSSSDSGQGRSNSMMGRKRCDVFDLPFCRKLFLAHHYWSLSLQVHCRKASRVGDDYSQTGTSQCAEKTYRSPMQQHM
jgi:hypothetical protein